MGYQFQHLSDARSGSQISIKISCQNLLTFLAAPWQHAHAYRMLICLISEVSSVCLLLSLLQTKPPHLKLRFQKSKLNSIVQTIQSNYSVSFKCGSSHMCLKCIRQRCLFWLCIHSYHPDFQKRTKINLLIFLSKKPTILISVLRF